MTNADKPVIIDFWAPWCRPCRQLAPLIEELEASYSDRIVVATVNADENPKTAARYVTGLPTIAVFQDGELVKLIVGAKPRHLLMRELADWLS